MKSTRAIVGISLVAASTMSSYLSRASSLVMRHRHPRTCYSVVASLQYQRQFSSARPLSMNTDNTANTFSRTEIAKMKVAELREHLESRGLDSSGIRDALVDRMREAVFGADHSQPRSGRTVVANLKLAPDRLYVLRFKGYTPGNFSDYGVGLVLYDASDEDEVWHGRKYFGFSPSPFEAEYHGIMMGFNLALDSGVRKLVLQGDNKVLLNQVSGSFKVTKDHLRPLSVATKEMTTKFDLFEVGVISSAENSRAKSLASRAVTSKKSSGLGAHDTWVPPEDSDTTSDPEMSTAPTVSESSSPVPQSDTKEELPELIIDPSKRYLLQIDGGSRGNPGVAGAGMVIYDDTGREVWCGWKFLSTKGTNNDAEYVALLFGLKCALSLGITDLRVEGDSDLVVKQMDGRYQVKSESLIPLYNSCKELIPKFDKIEISYIPRAQNKRADELANMAMDSRESFGFEDVI